LGGIQGKGEAHLEIGTRGSKNVVPKDHVGGQQKSRYYEKFKKKYKIV
jgi:hypothetical protein